MSWNIRLKRWYDASEEQYYDLTEHEIYFDSEHKQYKVKFECDCGKFLGWFCYTINQMRGLLYELEFGCQCSDCFEDDNIDYDFDEEDFECFTGVLCAC